MFVSTVGHSLT